MNAWLFKFAIVTALGLLITGTLCNVYLRGETGDRLALLLTAQGIFLVLLTIAWRPRDDS